MLIMMSNITIVVIITSITVDIVHSLSIMNGSLPLTWACCTPKGGAE